MKSASSAIFILGLLAGSILFPGSAHAGQSRIDSLQSALKTAKHDTSRVGILLAWAEAMYMTKPDSALLLWEQALRICKSSPGSADSKVKAHLLRSQAEAVNNMGYIFNSKGDVIKAREYYEESLRLRKLSGDKKGVAEAVNNLGFTFYNQGDIARAIEYFLHSMQLWEDLGDKKGLASALNNVGSIYEKQDNKEKALEFFLRGYEIQKQIDDKKAMSYTLTNIGAVYKKQGDLSKALEYYTESLKASEAINDKRSIAHSLNNIGGAYNSMGELDKALEYFEKGLTTSEEIGDKKGIAVSLASLGKTWLAKGNQNKALAYGNRSMAAAKELGFPQSIQTAAELLQHIYREKKQWKEAYDMYVLMIQMRDSLYNSETKKATIRQQLKYQYEKKAAADSVKNAEMQKVKDAEIMAQQAELKQAQTQRYALFGGLGLVVCFTAFVYNRFRVTRRQKMVIEKQKVIVEEKSQEIANAKMLIEEKHKEVTDSIRYAKRIQQALISGESLFSQHLQEYFIFFRPRDIVSGDFYWSSLQDDNLWIAACDCTGHGVPGAFMSLLNISFLNEAVIEKKIQSPDEVLNAVRANVIRALSADGRQVTNDGMDCALLTVNRKDMVLKAACANNPLWICRPNHGSPEMTVVEPDKQPVGVHPGEVRPFQLRTFQLLPGDVIYAFSDGYSDQFGGPKGKKFKYKQLKDTLMAVCNEPLSKQKEILEQTFDTWKGSFEQVDDVTILGIKV